MKQATSTKSASKPVTKAANTTAPAAPAAPANTAMQAMAAVVTAAPTPPAATKRPAVTLVNGLPKDAPANAVPVTLAGHVYNGNLPATNPALRGVTGTVSSKVANTLQIGNGKGPRAGHNVTMWGAVQAALAAGKGTATAASLAAAAGSGGAAFVAYALRNGWLAASK